MAHGAMLGMNLPVYLTLARLAAAPAIAAMALATTPTASAVAGLAVLTAGATDLADGYLARKRHQESLLGATLDLAADKLLLLAVGAALMSRGLLPPWLLATLALREVAVGMLRFQRGQRGAFVTPSIWGKAKTACLTLGLAAVLLVPCAGTSGTFHSLAAALAFTLLGGGLALSLLSAADYFRTATHRRRAEAPSPLQPTPREGRRPELAEGHGGPGG